MKEGEIASIFLGVVKELELWSLDLLAGTQFGNKTNEQQL